MAMLGMQGRSEMYGGQYAPALHSMLQRYSTAFPRQQIPAPSAPASAGGVGGGIARALPGAFHPPIPPAAPQGLPSGLPQVIHAPPSTQPVTTLPGIYGQPQPQQPMHPGEPPRGTGPNGSMSPEWLAWAAQQPGANNLAITLGGSAQAPQQQQGTPTIGGTPGMPQLAQVSTPSMPEAVQAYLQAVQGSFQPYFNDQQQQLKAQLAASGIGASGAGNQGMQDLTAKQNAQVAGAVSPLIQQGFGQQFEAASGNTNAYNQALMQMVQNQLQAQLANQQMGMQGQEFNANLLNNAIMQNTGYANNAIFQGAGFGNSDYLNALQQQAGFLGSNLGALGYIFGNGTQGGLNAYMQGENLGSQYANQQGQNSGYNPNPSTGAFPFTTPDVGNVPLAPWTPPANPGVDPNAPPDPSLMPPALGVG